MYVHCHLNLWKAEAPKAGKECARRTSCCFEGAHASGLRSTELGQLRTMGTKTPRDPQGREQMLEAGPACGCSVRAQRTQSTRVLLQTEETPRIRECTFHLISSRRQGEAEPSFTQTNMGPRRSRGTLTSVLSPRA